MIHTIQLHTIRQAIDDLQARAISFAYDPLGVEGWAIDIRATCADMPN